MLFDIYVKYMIALLTMCGNLDFISSFYSIGFVIMAFGPWSAVYSVPKVYFTACVKAFLIYELCVGIVCKM